MAAKTYRRLRNALVAMLVLAAAFAAYRYTLHRMVEAKLDEIRKQGFPVTLAELDKWSPQPPKGENAADIYREAFAKNVKDRPERNVPIVGYSNLPPRGVSLTPVMREGIAGYLKTNEESLVLLHTAAAMPHCRFYTNLNVDTISFSGGGGMRQAARKLELETVYASDSGDRESTTKALLASIGLVRHFSDEPLAIPRLVQQACFGLTKDALERALSTLQFDSNQLGRVSTALHETEASLTISRVMASEMAWNDDAFSEMRRDNKSAGYQITTDYGNMKDSSAWNRNLLAFGYRYLGILDFDQLNYLRLGSTAVGISEQPLPQRIYALNTFAHETNQISAFLPESRLYIKLSCQFLNLDARFMASLRTARAGLSVESHRSEHGQLPDNLSPTFTDPFDGQPLRYKKLAKGYVVYSIGEDRKDDGGVEPKHGYLPGTDITFTVER